MQREKKKPVIGKRFMSGSLEKMIMTYSMKPAGKEETEKGAAPALLELCICNVEQLHVLATCSTLRLCWASLTCSNALWD